MSRLAVLRPIFHSEADFQHALAWQIREERPDLTIRLEYRSPHLDQRGYIDLWVTDGNESLGVELKYKTRARKEEVNGETFDLLNQSAQDIGRYDTLRDIERL